jgi:hypothetical protein
MAVRQKVNFIVLECLGEWQPLIRIHSIVPVENFFTVVTDDSWKIVSFMPLV